MSRIHDELLELIEHSGPFLTTPVLDRVFPQGIDALDREHARRLTSAREEWAEAQSSGAATDADLHGEWIRFVLKETLSYCEPNLLARGSIPTDLIVEISEHHERLSPEYALVEAKDGSQQTRLLIQTWPATQDLEKMVEGSAWSSSPMERMTILCRGTGVRLGLVTNGERWMLADAPVGETAGYASWYASLWNLEPLTLRSFQALLGTRRFFGVSEKDTLESMLTESVAHQKEVTDRLGTQVRQAVELLVQSLDRADIDRNRKLLKDVSPKRLYDGALTVMMRLVFLFCAEERGLLLLDDPDYDAHYAVSSLRGRLREEADRIGIEILERRKDAWARLLATFRAVFGGVQHETLLMPALGGSLLDPDRYPFLEGRAEDTTWTETPAQPLPIDNRTVLHLLESLQVLKMPGGGARQLSFRALDIEQIGHVYEGLLDHIAVRVDQVTLGLSGAQGKEPEIALVDLEARAADGEEKLIEFLKAATKRSVSALRNALKRESAEEDVQRLQVACENDEGLIERILPFHALLREDVWGYPVVYRAGSFMVTEGTERRESGTHYTGRALTEPIVQHTLEPLVYIDPAKGSPPKEWKLKSSEELLDLKICDMAMGSAAFLVQVCRWLGERLVESWEAAEADGAAIRMDGQPIEDGRGQELLPPDRDERLLTARRLISERCIYGVDINPMAVELGKLSIWLITMSKGRPFAFLDHNLKCGDSLLGIANVEQLLYFHADPGEGKKLHSSLFDPKPAIREALDRTLALRKEIREIEILDIEDVRHIQRLNVQAQEALERTALIADVLSGILLSTAGQSDKKRDQALVDAAGRIEAWLSGNEVEGEKLVSLARDTLDTNCPEALKPREPFHWTIEFPEAFAEGGFHAVVGNPPFKGGQKLTGSFGKAYREHLVEHLASGLRGSADLCTYFYLRGTGLLRSEGMFGMLATNTISQGDTREVGLEQILGKGFSIPRAIPSQKWPGQATIEVAIIWILAGEWTGVCTLGGDEVPGITAFLTRPGDITGKPHQLKANAGKGFIGTIVLGLGFTLEPGEAEALIREDQRNAEVLFPYLIGKDLNARPDQSPSRWVINFRDWPLDRSGPGRWSGASKQQQKQWQKEGRVPVDYPDPVAADYPDCLGIVEEKVKPERTRVDANGEYVVRYPRCVRWWQFAERTPKLYQSINGLKEVVVATRVSKYISHSVVRADQIFDVGTNVFVLDPDEFAVVNSQTYEGWAREYGSTLRLDLRYAHSDCFETFPFPEVSSDLARVGKEFMTLRNEYMRDNSSGLTETLNALHSNQREAQPLRDAFANLEASVLAAYGWDDIALEMGFRETGYGIRFTYEERSRREITERLLALNHKRYQEEVEQGLHS